MKRFVVAIFLSSIALFGCGAKSAYKVEPINILSEIGDFSTVANMVRPAVVTIYSRTNATESLGSGVCISDSGHIVTNSHVVLPGGSNYVYTLDGGEYYANMCYRDESRDIAIIKVSAPIPYLEIASDYSVGEAVLAIGTPLSYDFKGTVTSGIISATDRVIEVEGDNGPSYMQGLIQHDASINPGNSGGALINSRGQLIGINTLKVSTYEGLGFAIPAKSITGAVSRLSSSDTIDVPEIGILGFSVDVARANGADVSCDRGLYIASVKEDSAAMRSGLRVGDCIKTISGKNIDSEADLMNLLYETNAGDTLTIIYSRAGRDKSTICCPTKK